VVFEFGFGVGGCGSVRFPRRGQFAGEKMLPRQRFTAIHGV